MPLNPKLPDKLDSGPGFLKRVTNSIRAFAIENRITTVTVREKVGDEQVSGQLEAFANGSGVALKLIVGGGSGSFAFPFQLINASNAIDGTQIRVRYGVVNDGTVGDDILPDGMSPGDDPVFIIPVTGASGTIYLEITTDSSSLEVTSITIETDSTTPASSTNVARKELGSFAIDTMPDPDVITSIAQAVITSLGYVNANGAHVYWQI